MKYAFLFLITLSIAICFPSHNYTKEERIQKRKELQKKMVECVLEGDISASLKSKVEEYKDEKSYKIYSLFSSKLSESDRDVLRKCRREMIMNMRKIYGGRADRFYNYSRIHDHFRHFYQHGNRTFEHNHGEFNSSSHHLDHDHPLHSNHHEFDSPHSHSFNSTHSHMHDSNFSHVHPSNSFHSLMHNASSSHSHPSGSNSHPHSSNTTQQ